MLVEDIVFAHGPYIARAVSLSGGVTLAALCAITIVRPHDFTHFILALWLLAAALLIVGLEASSQVAVVVLDQLPALKKMTWRAAFYIACGLFVMGAEWGNLGAASGLTMWLAGAAWWAVWYANRRKGAAVTAQFNAAVVNSGDLSQTGNPTAFLRFEDGLTEAMAHEAPYSQV